MNHISYLCYPELSLDGARQDGPTGLEAEQVVRDSNRKTRR